jgi:tetratricopeptide (TPR) repeat protein
MAYHTKGDTQKALTCFEKAIAANYDREGRSIAHSNLGMIYLQRGNMEKAGIHFRASIEERESYATPHYGLGLAGLEKVKKATTLEEARNHITGAISSFRKAIALNPRYLKALWGLASAYGISGDIANREGKTVAAVKQYEAAIETFEKLTRIDPQFPRTHPQKAAYIEGIRKSLK